jgi:archaellum biogenesis protein FlaJ (TadC family)
MKFGHHKKIIRRKIMVIELTSFVLGMLTVLLIGVVVGVVRANKKTNELSIQSDELARLFNDEVSTLNLRIDGDIGEVNKEIEKLYREMDSRMDKFSNKVEKQLLKG